MRETTTTGRSVAYPWGGAEAIHSHSLLRGGINTRGVESWCIGVGASVMSDRSCNRCWQRPQLVWLSLAACLAAGCGHEPQPAAQSDAPAELPVIKAAVFRVEPSAWPTIVKTQGSLIADEVTVVGAKVGGRVAEVYVDLGDTVAAGAPLAMLDQEEFKLQVVLAEAQLMQSRAALGMKPTDPVESLDRPKTPRPSARPRPCWDEARPADRSAAADSR